VIHRVISPPRRLRVRGVGQPSEDLEICDDRIHLGKTAWLAVEARILVASP